MDVRAFPNHVVIDPLTVTAIILPRQDLDGGEDS